MKLIVADAVIPVLQARHVQLANAKGSVHLDRNYGTELALMHVLQELQGPQMVHVFVEVVRCSVITNA